MMSPTLVAPVLALAFAITRTAAAALPEAIDPEARAPEAGAMGSRASVPAPAAPEPGEGKSAADGPASAAPMPVPSSPITGDAEPAPGAMPDGPPLKTRHRIAVAPRFAYRLGDAGRTISPAAGYGVGGTFEWTYARPARQVELALGVDFASDRFATAERGVTTQSGNAVPYDSTRLINESTFVLTHTVAFPAGPVRPFLTVGGGIGFGDFESIEVRYRPGSLQDRQLLGRVALGIDVVVTRIWFATLRVDYTAVRRTDRLLVESGGRLAVFGDLLDINLGLAYRF
jgi:hypothetical protein